MIWIAAADELLPDRSGPGERLAARVAARVGRLRSNRARGRGAVSEPSQEIIEQACAGDADAFAEIFRAHGDDVLRVCRRMLGGADAAADAQSEVFLKARRALDGFDRARSFRAWLLSIASHHCIDQLRRTATEHRVFADVDLEPGDLAGPEPSPLSRLLARERAAELDAAVEALPIKYRLPLLMRFVSEASYDEIAEALGTTRGQVGTLLFRAKRMLRTRMSGAAPAEPGPPPESEPRVVVQRPEEEPLQ